MILCECLLYTSDGIGYHKLEPVHFRLTGCQGKRCRGIPLLGALPLMLGKGFGMYHPIVEAFKRHPARCRIGEDWSVVLSASSALA